MEYLRDQESSLLYLLPAVADMAKETLHQQGPDFMMTLGLLPPYTLDDVKQAYMRKARLAHPDHGGDAKEFLEIGEAYQQAQDYLAMRSDRRGWIASQMDRYLAQSQLEDRLRELGASVSNPHTDWLAKSFGDLAELTACIDSIELPPGSDGDAVIDLMVSEQESLSKLRRIVLTDCSVTIDRALLLANFGLLRHINLSKNRLDGRISQIITSLPMLRELRLERTGVGWLQRSKINTVLKGRN